MQKAKKRREAYGFPSTELLSTAQMYAFFRKVKFFGDFFLAPCCKHDARERSRSDLRIWLVKIAPIFCLLCKSPCCEKEDGSNGKNGVKKWSLLLRPAVEPVLVASSMGLPRAQPNQGDCVKFVGK